MIHIFVVDDDNTNLNVAGHILRTNNMQVTALHSGQALLDTIRTENRPDLILLDIKMPEMDGFETLEKLRVLEKKLGIHEIPVIFLTADETADTEKQGFEAGVSDYIRKPFDPDILLRRVNNIVAKEKRLSSLRAEADTDKLTGFLNKAASHRIISGLCSSDLGCLMMIDLDSFKLVNDLFGHKMGDNVLICFAALLRGIVPEGSRIGRIGGDEFLVFASGVQKEETIAALTEQINSELLCKAKELMGADMGIPLGASVGCVFVPMAGEDFDSLFRLADKALYSVKKNGKHGYSLYHTAIEREEALLASENDIDNLSEILGERTIPNVALQLEKEAFSYVYRYIMRYTLRNNRSFYKLLITLQAKEGINERDFKDYCDEFGNMVREGLRKTDILMRNRFNQYFVLLTDTKESDISVITENLLHRWELNGSGGVNVSFMSRFVRIDAGIKTDTGEFNIVIVDDDEINLKLAGHVLSKAGYHVSAMKSGRTLLKYLTDHSPDLILLDVKMPDPDGFETMRQLRQIRGAEQIPVVFLTADSDEETERTGLKLGAEDFLRKPFIPETMIKRIRRITELSALRKKLYGAG